MLSTMLEALLFALILAAPCLAAWAGAKLLTLIRERRRRKELARARELRRAYVQNFFRQIQDA